MTNETAGGERTVELKNLMNRLKQNRDEWMELEDQIFRQYDMVTWKEFLENRSKVLRRIFAEDETMLAELKEYLKQDLDKQKADELFDALSQLYYDAYDDSYLFELVGNRLLEFYEQRQDYGKIVTLTNMIAYEIIDYYSHYKNTAEGICEPARNLLKVVTYRDHYTEIADAGMRRFFYTAYGNLIASLSEGSLGLREQVFDLYEQAYQMWEDPAVQALDGDNEDIRFLMWRLDESFLSVEDYILECDDGMIRRFFAKAEEIITRWETDEEMMRPGGYVTLIRNKRKVLYGEISRHQVVEEYISYLNSMTEPDYEDPDIDKAERRILDIHGLADSILYWLRSDEFTPQERQAYLDQFLPRTMKIMASIPYHFSTSLINDICILWYKNAGAVLPEYESRMEFLKRMVICRQPLTYIHSLMVAKIAVLVAEEILRKCPELFLETFEKDSVEKILAERDNILEYIDRCGLLHDIGKTQIVDIINQQTRRLSDREFALIKQHPEKGFELLEDDAEFAPYYDVIIGHHKTYDGKGGYPESFDNTRSPKRFLIDLITIADCTDAATDILGRNYTSGKNFYTLLEELKKGAGSRYNPDIVRIIEESVQLQQNLTELTSTGRYGIYYEACQFIEHRKS